MPDVTIIIPHYNCWAYLPGAVKSAKEQTVKCDIIVIEQCSTDHCTEPIQELKGTTTVYQAEKLPWSETLNQGFRMATTPWVVILNGDDQILPDMVEKCLTISSGCGIVFPGTRYLEKSLLQANCVCYCALIHQDTWKAVGGFNDIEFSDWDFWIRCWKAGIKNTSAMNDGLFLWADRPDGMTAIMKRDGSYDRAVEKIRGLHRAR